MKIKNTNIQVVQGEISALKGDMVVPPLTAKSPGEKDIREHCRRFLQEAETKAVGSLAFPAIGCGAGGFPPVGSAKIMAQEILKYLRSENLSLKEIIFCLSDKEAFDVFDKTVKNYLEYMTYKMQQGPYVTVDAIIELKEGIILIERSNPPYGWALPGGFVDYGESLEQAVTREAKEETDMDLEGLRQFRIYSDPDRDPRFHTVAAVFTAKGKGTPRAGDDAQGLKVVRYGDLLTIDYAFDHKRVIEDYLEFRNKTV